MITRDRETHSRMMPADNVTPPGVDDADVAFGQKRPFTPAVIVVPPYSLNCI